MEAARVPSLGGNFTLLFDVEPLRPEHLSKDVGLFPLYVERQLGHPARIVYLQDRVNNGISASSPADIQLVGVRCWGRRRSTPVPVYRVLKSVRMLIYLVRRSRSIAYLMLFHLRRVNYLYAIIYGVLNPRGRIWLKLDMNEQQADHVDVSLLRRMARRAKFLSAESATVVRKLNRLLLDPPGLPPISLVPNGYDDLNYPVNVGQVIRRKRPIILTVGRIGTREKNTELLLRALQLRGLPPDWEIRIIGPTEPSFDRTKSEWAERNRSLGNQVHYIGEIRDRSRLFEHYSEASVFVLTSRWESFPHVLLEAVAHGCYVVSVDLAPSRDLISTDSRVGLLVPQDDAGALGEALAEAMAKYPQIEYTHIMQMARRYYQSQVIESVLRGVIVT